jgi:hypothetical protein
MSGIGISADVTTIRYCDHTSYRLSGVNRPMGSYEALVKLVLYGSWVDCCSGIEQNCTRREGRDGAIANHHYMAVCAPWIK